MTVAGTGCRARQPTSWIDGALAHGDRHGLRPVDGVELAARGAHVLVHGALGDVENLPDLPCGLAARHPCQHLALAWRQRRCPAGARRAQCVHALERIDRDQMQRQLVECRQVELRTGDRCERGNPAGLADRHQEAAREPEVETGADRFCRARLLLLGVEADLVACKRTRRRQERARDRIDLYISGIGIELEERGRPTMHQHRFVKALLRTWHRGEEKRLGAEAPERAPDRVSCLFGAGRSIQCVDDRKYLSDGVQS